MRIGVNVRRLQGQRLGIGRYLEYMLHGWAEYLRPDESMELYLRAPLGDGDEWIERTFDTRVLGPALTGVTWETLVMGRHLDDIDVFFGPSYSLPLNYDGPSVVAIHSINETIPGAHPWWYRFTFEPLYRTSARRADAVIVPSPLVRDGVHRFYDIPLDRITVVREGAPDAFRPLDDHETIRSTRLEYTGRDEPYILFVGKFSKRRNIPLLIRSFARMKRESSLPHNLLLLGPNHLDLPLEELVRELSMEEHVTITNRHFADHADIMPVYSAAELYAFPSLFEGASNTVVEAMSCGVPVVAGRCDAIADIVEGSGVLIDDITVDSLADAMRSTLTDRNRWSGMRERGLEKSRSLRWGSTARQTMDVIRRVAEK